MNDRSSTSDGPEPAVEALLDAVERVCATQSPSTLSMRVIASDAGCSLGLAYNYFDSKEQLMTAALDRMAERLTASAAGSDDPRESLLALMDAMRRLPAFPRLLTWLVLEGQNVSDVLSAHPLMQQVATRAARDGAADPTTTAMTTGLLAIGAFTYGEMLNQAVGRQSDDGLLTAAIADIYQDFYPGTTA